MQERGGPQDSGGYVVVTTLYYETGPGPSGLGTRLTGHRNPPVSNSGQICSSGTQIYCPMSGPGLQKEKSFRGTGN